KAQVRAALWLFIGAALLTLWVEDPHAVVFFVSASPSAPLIAVCVTGAPIGGTVPTVEFFPFFFLRFAFLYPRQYCA
ncbi:hypothetical protein, partial [Klebsiella pneumoniae]|uniref:hypothetical protein n=1 Tax=Klebsiella pneumoniae TaxID=573 RepID=UPI003B5C74B1